MGCLDIDCVRLAGDDCIVERHLGTCAESDTAGILLAAVADKSNIAEIRMRERLGCLVVTVVVTLQKSVAGRIALVSNKVMCSAVPAFGPVE